MTFTDEVKQELARLPIGDGDAVRAELAALLRFGGALVLGGGDRGIGVDLETVAGATARRTYTLLQRRYDVAPELRVRAPGGVQRRRLYGVRLDGAGDTVARDLGLLGSDGRPTPAAPVVGEAGGPTVRGAFLAAGSVSAPDRPPHLELVAHRRDAAEALAVSLGALVDGRVAVAPPRSDGRDERPRVVVKSGSSIGEVLAAIGATGAFLRWEERRLRRQVRSEATRLANADAANLRRTVEAASSQIQAVERVVAEIGWDDLDEDLRGVALARLVSPDASLVELGQLTDPPLTKSAVHRRLRRLVSMAEGLEPGPTEGRC
ncbi:MAG: DNA-binding protein WhiA [Nitriliruptor sp.]|uniref:DNA-binding protein WhiA n=1 Tax=Nitriliruptor sp. TaxID=2448056 RepID=UPI0034A03DCB